MNAEPDIDDALIEIRPGRRAASWTDVKDWVALACDCAEPGSDGGRAGAKCQCAQVAKLYQVLRMHVNRKRGDRRAWPTTDALAALMGRGRGDKVAPWIAQLVKLEAVEVKRVGVPGRYVYTVHDEPPAGYTGPVSLGQWYERHRGLLKVQRAAAAAKRGRQTARSLKALVKPDTPIPGVLDLAVPDTPMSGYLAPPMSGYQDPPTSGVKPDVVEPDEVNPPLPPRSAAPTQRSGAARQGGEDSQPPTPDPVRALVTELVKIRPDWRYVDQRVRAALAQIGERHPFPVIRLALLDLAANTADPTESPKRVAADGPWWPRAYAAEMAARPPSVGRAARESCLRCDPAGWVLDVEPARRCDHEPELVDAGGSR